MARRERWEKLPARVALDAPAGGRSTSPLDHMDIRPRVLLIASVSCFVASLCSSTFGGDRGIGALAFGWLEVTVLSSVGPFVAFAWFANPLLFLTWWLGSYPRSRTAAIVTGTIASCLCLGYILFGRAVVNDESGIPHIAVSWTIAYAFWLLSVFIALFRAILTKASDAPLTHNVV